MVTPLDRRSLTRKTVLMTSLPRLSKTKTFQIGCPSAFVMGLVCDATLPFAPSCSSPSFGTSAFKARILRIDTAIEDQQRSWQMVCHLD